MVGHTFNHMHNLFLVKTVQTATVCKMEVSNAQDAYAVAVMHGASVVGHVLKTFQQPVHFSGKERELFGKPSLETGASPQTFLSDVWRNTLIVSSILIQQICSQKSLVQRALAT